MATEKLSVVPVEEGNNLNSARVYSILLSITVEGIDKPFTSSIGKFDEGYQKIAEEFCRWFNDKVDSRRDPQRNIGALIGNGPRSLS